MEDSPSPSLVRSCLKPTRRKLLIACAALSVFAISEFLATTLLRTGPHAVAIPISLIALGVATATLLVTGAIIHFATHWKLPARRLATVLHEISTGQRPIEDIPADLGGLNHLVPVLSNLLRELKTQKSEVAKLEHEMSQKVAQRTDALQRSLGTLKAQATRDGLTGLFNRRMLDQSLEEVVTRNVAQRQSVCVLMIDVDDFKLLNDTLGHAQGDELLKAIGQLIRSCIRQDDLPFRCGGDEFVILMPQAYRADADALAKRLTELVDALTKPLNVKRKPRLSIGISSPADIIGPASGKELLEQADRHLYQVKSTRKAAIKSVPHAA